MTEVRIAGLRKSFGGQPALVDVALEAAPGEMITLLGPSGCGKTTTLRCVAGFLAPDGGDILVDGRSILDVPLRRRDFGVVFQNYALFPHMTVTQNVAYGLRVRRIGAAEIASRVAASLAEVGLTGLGDRLPRTLSGGQQQRVALARALVIHPRLLLLDEPLANLDAQLRQEMRALIRAVQRRQGITAFYVTHDQAEAMASSDRVAVMERGRVAQFATPREIYQRPVSRYVAAFTGEASALAVTLRAAHAPDRYTVGLGDAQMEVPGAAGLSPGSRHFLMVRPQAVTFGPSGIPATVREVAFFGATQQGEVELAGQALRFVTDPNERVVAGETVHVTLDPAHAWLMPEAAA
ncbi:MAG: ABC transporter ATP-binding protein [Rhodospirillales bacterium]|nr:ABC transporter ATP-binding protein [Rhodospirillales bacterium]MBN8897753.1 ABC transporter ATP-binding protein [Rhodospirillales bacterium]